jgi:TDG/mug DNA glycosylase family protein
MERLRPTKADLAAAEGKTVADILAPHLKILFCGINPGLYSAAVGHHFARPGNRFWPALFAAGLTPRLLSPFEERELLEYGFGITNVVRRASARADVLTTDEYREGGQNLKARVHAYQPRILAVLGIGAFRNAFDLPRAGFGRQEIQIGDTLVWALPNPSGLNAHFSLADLADSFSKLKTASDSL